MYKRSIALFLLALPLASGAPVIFRLLSGLFSFSNRPLGWLAASALLMLSLIRGLKTFWRTLLALCLFTACLWLPNAFQTPYQHAPELRADELLRLCDFLSGEAEQIGSRAADPEEIAAAAAQIFSRQPPKYAKHAGFMRRLGLSGIFLPFSGEAIVNPTEAPFLLPFVCAHELSHAEGLLNEGQANTRAFLRCVYSDSEPFRYAAYVYALKLASSALNSLGARFEIPKDLLSDVNKISAEYIGGQSIFKNYDDMVSCLIQLQRLGLLTPSDPTA